MLSARGQMCFCRRGWFTNEIMQFTVYRRELMRDAIGNDDHLTFGDLMFVPAFDLAPADFVRRDFFGIDGFSCRDEGGRSIDYIDHIRIERVDFCLARFNPAAGVHFVTRGFQQWLTFRKSR